MTEEMDEEQFSYTGMAMRGEGEGERGTVRGEGGDSEVVAPRKKEENKLQRRLA